MAADQAQPTTFGISIGELFRVGAGALRNNPAALVGTALATFLAYGVFRYLASQSGTLLAFIGFDLLGLVLASVVALPWYRAALDAYDGKRSNPPDLVQAMTGARDQMVASIFFWAGVYFGIRYLLGIPSIFVVVLYAFYGFIVSEGNHKGGMRALGHSVVLGEGRRVGIAGIGLLLVILNLFGAVAVGFEELPDSVGWALAIVGLLITTNLSMTVGAALYRHLSDNPITKGAQ